MFYTAIFLAFMPGPIIFGLIIDSTCLIWQEECEQKGSCLLYDTNLLRSVTHGTGLVLGICTLIVGTIGAFLLRIKKYADPPESYKDGRNSYIVTPEESVVKKSNQVEPI